MIYRKRIKKSGYSIKLLPLHLKIEFGKRVWYFNVLGIGKPWHKTMQGIKDIFGYETVTHTRRRNRVTVYRQFHGLPDNAVYSLTHGDSRAIRNGVL